MKRNPAATPWRGGEPPFRTGAARDGTGHRPAGENAENLVEKAGGLVANHDFCPQAAKRGKSLASQGKGC